MAKITRYSGDLKPFASNSTGLKRTVFGDITQADDIDSNITTDFLLGWESIGDETNNFPTIQDFNAMGYTHGQLLAYLHQVGVPEWSGTQEYHSGSIVNLAGVLYICNTNSHVSATAPNLDATNWKAAAQANTDSIASLRLTAPGTTPVQLTGYYTPGDGGGGPLRVWKTGAIGTYVDNGGSIIVPTGGDGSGAWVWEHSGAVDVKWFGATGTAGADDHAKIQAAWDFVGALGSGEVTHFGTFEISAPLNPSKANPTDREPLVYSGVGTIKRHATFSGDRLINMSAINGFDDENIISFYDLTFDGVNKSINGIDWMNMDVAYNANPTLVANTGYAKAINFIDCHFVNCYRGTRVSGNSNNFIGCHYRNNVCGTANMTGANDIRYIGCSFRRGTLGVDIQTSSAILGTVCNSFTNCIFESNTRAGTLLLNRPTATVFTNCYWENNGYSLTDLQYDASYILPVKAAHMISEGASYGVGSTTIIGGHWQNATIDIYGRVDRFALLNNKIGTMEVLVINGLSSTNSIDSVASINVLASTDGTFILDNHTYDVRSNVVKKRGISGYFLGLAAAASGTILTAEQANDSTYILTVSGSSSVFQIFIAHLGTNSVTQLVKTGAGAVSSAAWSGNDLIVTASASTGVRASAQKIQLSLAT